MEKSIVLKVGGSVLYDANLEVNFDLLKKLKTWYYESKNEYSKIIIVTGGGNLSRDLQKKIAGAIGGEEYLHNIAMSVTQTNAAMIQGYIEDPISYIPKRLGDAYEYLSDEGKKTLISGGMKVGWSTDMDAAIYADMVDIDSVLKISNIDYVYDSDPKVNPQAKYFKNLKWEEYLKLFNIMDSENYKANENSPIDVMCAQFCANKGISFFICGGNSIKTKSTIQEILQEGTLIE